MEHTNTKLTITKLSKSYHHRGNTMKVLQDISLKISEGEIISVLGKSGTGKSTLLHLIAGLEKPNSGSIENPFKTGYVFQDAALFPWLTVTQNLLLGMRNNLTLSRQEKELQCEQLLNDVQIPGTGSRFPAQLSGGERQRAAIAQVLATGSTLLLLDEPFAALDAFTRRDMNNLLQNIVIERGLTVIYVTHNIEEALFLSGRVFIIGGSPAHIDEEMNIKLPYPRPADEEISPEFIVYKKKILSTFKKLAVSSPL